MATTATSSADSQRMCPLCGALTDAAACAKDGQATVRASQPGFARFGTVIGDRYRLTELLGRGGFGDVYKAFHMGTHESVAVKILRPDLGGEPSAVDRFTAEARMSAQLHHPNTVRVFDFGTTPDAHLYLAMEFLDGDSLEVLLEAEGRLQPQRAVRLVAQVLKSLAEAHGRHIIHRDLKPDNIFVVELAGERDFVRVIDFGIAKFLGDSQQLTQFGAILGTPHYMSPEQIRGDVLDARSDLYGLGVVMFRCLTGKFPCVGDNQFGILAAHLSETPPAMSEAGVQIDPRLEAVVRRALEKDRSRRFPDAESMRLALEAWQAVAAPDPESHSDTQAMCVVQAFVSQDDSATQAMAVLVPEQLAGAVAQLSNRAPSRASIPQAPTALPLKDTAAPSPAPAPAPAPSPNPNPNPTPSPNPNPNPNPTPSPNPNPRPRPHPAPKAPVSTPEPDGVRKTLGVAGDSKRPVGPPRDPAATQVDSKSRPGLQRRRPDSAPPPKTADDGKATRAMSVMAQETQRDAKAIEYATERGASALVAVPRRSRSWLAMVVISLLLVGGGLGVLLALRAHDVRPPVAPVPVHAAKAGCTAPEGSAEWCSCAETRGDTAGLPYFCACRLPKEHFVAGSAPWCKCNAGAPACD